ncbi:MAG: hypothetical protein Q7J38_00905 [Gallionella sp.]|nr:hypothetical protein [Gallionella sp.]
MKPLTHSFDWCTNNGALKIRWLLLALALMAGSAWSDLPAPEPAKFSSSPNSNATQENQKTGLHKSVTKPLPVPIEIAPSSTIKVEANDKAEKHNDYFSAEWWLVYSTFILAIITFGLALYTAKLYRATVGLGKEAKGTSERQAREMEKSLAIADAAAQAAISGNELTRKTFVSSQRPWVVIHKIVPRSALDLNHGLSFAFIVKNVGHSPAMNVDVSALVHLPHRGDAHEVHRNLRDERARTRPTLLSNDVSIGHLIIPNEEMEIQVQIGIDLVEFQKAASTNPFGEIIILILGQVSYSFGIEGSQHESGFIFSVCRRGGAWATINDGIIPVDEVEIKRFPAGFYAS